MNMTKVGMGQFTNICNLTFKRGAIHEFKSTIHKLCSWISTITLTFKRNSDHTVCCISMDNSLLKYYAIDHIKLFVSYQLMSKFGKNISTRCSWRHICADFEAIFRHTTCQKTMLFMKTHIVGKFFRDYFTIIGYSIQVEIKQITFF